MDCKTANEHLKSLTFNVHFNPEVEENFYPELNEHIEQCTNCSSKWLLDKKIIGKLEKYYDEITASDSLKKKIQKSVGCETSKLYWIRTTAIAVSFVLVLGLGLIADRKLLRLPHAYEIHNVSNYNLLSNDIEDLLQYIKSPLSKNQFSKFEKAAFIPHGSLKINKLINKKISTIALKNDKGQKLTLCFYPGNYKLVHKDSVQVNGIKVYHGSTNNYNFAYWPTNGMTIVLISDSLLSDEMIDLATPLITDNDV